MNNTTGKGKMTYMEIPVELMAPSTIKVDMNQSVSNEAKSAGTNISGVTPTTWEMAFTKEYRGIGVLFTMAKMLLG
ncbi:MAG TPA: hypothetical protein ENN76_02925 [Euryarchaeota archaeon]|nr:hypothetical protein [Euryarchaeota archaeon]